MTYLTPVPISHDALRAEVSSTACGGTCLFLGTVRDGPDEHGVTAVPAYSWAPCATGQTSTG